MKLKKGETIRFGKRIFKDEIPDDIAKELGLIKQEPKGKK